MITDTPRLRLVHPSGSTILPRPPQQQREQTLSPFVRKAMRLEEVRPEAAAFVEQLLDDALEGY